MTATLTSLHSIPLARSEVFESKASRRDASRVSRTQGSDRITFHSTTMPPGLLQTYRITSSRIPPNAAAQLMLY